MKFAVFHSIPLHVCVMTVPSAHIARLFIFKNIYFISIPICDCPKALVLTGGSGAGVSSTSFSGSDYQLGLLVVATASLLSGISAALTQKHLVDYRKRHPFFFSAELAIYGIVFLLGNLLVRSDVAPGGSLFSHWTPLTLIPVVTNVRQEEFRIGRNICICIPYVCMYRVCSFILQ
jgi:hypothetical protein